MSPSGEDPEASETSPLLASDTTKLIDASNGALPDAPIQYGAVNGSASGNENGDGATDSEAAGAGNASESNPLLEGHPEMMRKLRWLFPAVSIGVLLGAADQTIIVSSYGKIGSELNALNNTSWIATSYFLTLTTFQPLYGKLSDIFGRKPCLLFAYAVFGIGCVFCGLSRNIQELVAARAFSGIGGGGMMTVVSVLMSDIIPLRQRGTWQGYINIIYSLGAMSGAPLGGLLADSAGWRWAFLVQGPMCLVAFLAVYFVLDEPKKDDTDWKHKLGRVDFLGAFMLIVSTTTFLVGLDNGSNVGWNNTLTITCMSVAVPLYIIFVLVEVKVAQNPFAPGRVIFDRSLFAAFLCNFFSFAAFMSVIFYIPLFLQAVVGLSATQAGLRLIPNVICSTTGSVSGGLIMQKTGRYYWLTVTAYVLTFTGTTIVLLFSGVVMTSPWVMIGGMCLGGIGGGIGVTTTLIALISNAGPKDQAIVTACSYLFRSLGSVVGISLSATAVQQSLRVQLQQKLDGSGDTDEIVRGVRQSLDFIKTLAPAIAAIVRQCYQRALSTSFALAVTLATGPVICAFFIREKKLSR